MTTYVPPHLAAAFKEEELSAFVAVFEREDAADGDANGFIDGDRLDELMVAAGETVTEKKKQDILAECDPKGSGNVPFLDLLRILSRLRFKRDAFGGRRCISDDVPLPLRVATEYDLPCLQHPEKRAQVTR